MVVFHCKGICFMFYQINAVWCSYDGDIFIIFILQVWCLGSKRDCLCSCHTVACGTLLFFITLRAGLRKKNVHYKYWVTEFIWRGKLVCLLCLRMCVYTQFVQCVYLVHWELPNTLIQLPVQQKQVKVCSEIIGVQQNDLNLSLRETVRPESYKCC